MSIPTTPVNCDFKSLTPEDFFRKWVRTDGSGKYALAIKDVTLSGPWVEGASCNIKGITWQDVVSLIAGIASDGKYAINVVIET